MKVAIVYNGSFPYSGLASCEHIISYTKGLVKIGIDVCVLALQPNVKKKSSIKQIPQIIGSYEGVNYFYPSGTVFWPNGFFSSFQKLFIQLKNIYAVDKYFKHNKIDVVLFVVSEGFDYRLWHWICKKNKYKFVVERTELSPVYKEQSYYNATLFRRLYKWYVEKGYYYPDEWIVETKTLQNYFQHFANPQAIFHILPMTVEIERFSQINRETKDGSDYIAYCGNMREDDGVSILIKAFHLIAEKYPKLQLKLAGWSNDTPSQKELVKQLGLDDRVEFLGKISREIIPDFLGNAKLLALASPTSLRSCATMPCKVGEYLCTGVPVVVTGLGEINNYLTDGENAYLTQPDSDVLFAQKMDQALSDNEENRNRIVENGKQIAVKYFSASSQANTLLEIFTKIIQNK